MGRIKILFYNKDGAGVKYFRTLTPAVELERSHSDVFDIEINDNINFNNDDYIEYLKTFDIIHYHKELHPNPSKMAFLASELKKNDTVLVMDIDDYWLLPKQHPQYYINEERKTHLKIINNLKIADYVTTTTEIFADEIKKITNKDNVFVFYNAINPEGMKQFENNWKEDENGLVRITYMGGSSHLGDLKQLENVVNILNADYKLKDKFKIILAGWDTVGVTTEIKFNEEFGKELQKSNLWNINIINKINKAKGDIRNISEIPQELRIKYDGGVFTTNQRQLESHESPYFEYEKILTDNHKIIKDSNYLRWLMTFERKEKYDNESIFARRWTKPANSYANVLDETDIVLAPLSNNQFNICKSNLKQLEASSRKLPIVCSDIPPYNVDGKHMVNSMLIPVVKNQHKYWVKALRRLILEPELRTKIGNQLYNDFKDKYNLKNVTNERKLFYERIVNNLNKN